MRRLPVLIILLLCSLNFALWAKSKPEKQLQANLAQWEQFRWQGMAQVMHEAFTLRKFYVLAKNTEALRLDILDSGVLGLNAKPMLALYVKDRIVLDAPSIKELEGIDLNWFVTPDKYKPFFAMTTTLQSHSAEIISNRKISLSGLTYLFDKKYRLTGIISPKLQLEAQVTYNRKSQPDKISLIYQGKELAIFTIDEITTEHIEITPLEIGSQSSRTTDIDNTEEIEIKDSPKGVLE
jgi:hypothetical protein